MQTIETLVNEIFVTTRRLKGRTRTIIQASAEYLCETNKEEATFKTNGMKNKRQEPKTDVHLPAA